MYISGSQSEDDGPIYSPPPKKPKMGESSFDAGVGKAFANVSYLCLIEEKCEDILIKL